MSVLAAVAVPHPPIILPEVGRGEEKKISKTSESYTAAMRRVAELNPETIVIISPHTVMYRDYFHISPGSGARGDMGAFRAPNVIFWAEYDADFVHELSDLAALEGLPAGTRGERDKALDHGTMIPLYFLNKVYSGFKTVRVGLSGLSPMTHYLLGMCIAKTAEKLKRRVVIIASGDLSHKLLENGPYGFLPEGPEFDKQLTAALDGGDFLSLLEFSPSFSEAAAECGLRSFLIMAGALDRLDISHKLLSYEGPFGVGYAVAAFEVKGKDPNRDFGVKYEAREKERLNVRKEKEDEYVRLARLGVETYVKTGRPALMPGGVSDELKNERAGVFVSLKMHGQLRGCIGTISSMTDSVAEEILQNAVSAAASDPRFEPVTEDELPEIVYSVDVLGEPEEISSPDELDVGRYGVIVQSGGKRGLLLPNLEGINTVSEQISISKRKAGINDGETVKMFRFEVVRHE